MFIYHIVPKLSNRVRYMLVLNNKKYSCKQVISYKLSLNIHTEFLVLIPLADWTDILTLYYNTFITMLWTMYSSVFLKCTKSLLLLTFMDLHVRDSCSQYQTFLCN